MIPFESSLPLIDKLAAAFHCSIERKKERKKERKREGEMEKETDRQTDRQTDRRTDRQTDRQTVASKQLILYTLLVFIFRSLIKQRRRILLHCTQIDFVVFFFTFFVICFIIIIYIHIFARKTKHFLVRNDRAHLGEV